MYSSTVACRYMWAIWFKVLWQKTHYGSFSTQQWKLLSQTEVALQESLAHLCPCILKADTLLLSSNPQKWQVQRYNWVGKFNCWVRILVWEGRVDLLILVRLRWLRLKQLQLCKLLRYSLHLYLYYFLPFLLSLSSSISSSLSFFLSVAISQATRSYIIFVSIFCFFLPIASGHVSFYRRYDCFLSQASQMVCLYSEDSTNGTVSSL